MNWTSDISYFFGGVFLTNAIPHIVSGVTGRAFQSPFAKPPGEGLSSSITNIVWGFFNLTLAYVLTVCVGDFDLHSKSDVLEVGIGSFLIALHAAHNFGKFHGGNLPKT